MSAGVRQRPAGRLLRTDLSLKDIDLIFLCEAADIYVDLHLGLRFSKSAKSS